MSCVHIALIVLLIFNASSQTATAAQADRSAAAQAVLEAPPPAPNVPKTEMLKAYLARAQAAGELGDRERQMREINDGIQAVGPKDPLSYELYHQGANIAVEMGDWKTGRIMRDNALAVTNDRGRKFFQANFLSNIAVRMYDKEGAHKYINMAEELFNAVKSSNKQWPDFRDLWEAALSDAKGGVYGMLGYTKDAEAQYRACVAAIRSYLAKERPSNDIYYYYLPQCLSRAMEHAALLGKIREAAAYVDDAREAARIHGQRLRREAFEASRAARPIARVYLEQGLLREGAALIESSIAELQKARGGDAGIQVADLRFLLAQSEMAQGHWQKADEIFQGWRAALRQQMGELGTIAPEWSYTLLRLGRSKEALVMASAVLKFRENFDDEGSVRLHEGRAFHALAAAANGQRDSAVKTLAAAVPKILEFRRDRNSAGEDGYVSSARLNWFLDGYIALLADAHQRGARIDGIESMSEAFKMVDEARGSKVQKALSASVVRASSANPQAAAAMRHAQDMEHAVKAASEAVTILQNQEKSSEQAQALTKAQSELARLRQENEKAQADLRQLMPNYTELMAPPAMTLADAQKILRADEALISLYSTQDKTLVWAMKAVGRPAFAVVDLPQKSLNEAVAKLRKALDPSDVDINALPAYDYDTAYELYRKLLAPVEVGWKGARELVIVSHGALSELPLSVLVTAPFKPVKTGALPLAEHAEAPWLIKQAAVSYLPSLTALASLRNARTQQATKSFIGFGDPLFKDQQTRVVSPAVLTPRGFIRRNALAGIAPSNPADLLEVLQPLPDTADEVRDIAKILRADPNRDVQLGQRASERQVKQADLSDYRVVMFATHGLVPGELADLSQPALALSNPKLTGEKEDGLLTLAEILELKLRADWVVLSACNTASSDGQAAEAVSGLGRAFFYAGAKALLVSHWPVETVSAKLLTTELFKRQTSDAQLSRSQAMRDASLAVMRQSAGQNFSYAHPMFWAPFVVVGDGG